MSRLRMRVNDDERVIEILDTDAEDVVIDRWTFDEAEGKALWLIRVAIEPMVELRAAMADGRIG